MNRVEFTPCVNPTRGIIATCATLGITLIALKALDRLNAGTGIAATLLSAGAGFAASSLHGRNEEIQQNDRDSVPTMQDNELADVWSASEQERILDEYNGTYDHIVLREAALSGTIEVVRDRLKTHFQSNRSFREEFRTVFRDPLPLFNNLPLSPDHPILDLFNATGEARFEQVHNLLSEVQKADADPKNYTLPTTLPAEDLACIEAILPQMKEWREGEEKMVTRLSNQHGIDRDEMWFICEASGQIGPGATWDEMFEDSEANLDSELKENPGIPTPPEAWTDKTRALVRLHAHVNAKSLAELPLNEAATAKETEILECLLSIAEDRSWNVPKDEQTRLRDLAKS